MIQEGKPSAKDKDFLWVLDKIPEEKEVFNMLDTYSWLGISIYVLSLLSNELKDSTVVRGAISFFKKVGAEFPPFMNSLLRNKEAF